MSPGWEQSSLRIPTALPGGSADARLRLFFGGSFDPPHRGHMLLPQRVRDALHTPDAWILYVPAARSPLKCRAPIQDHHRLEMLRRGMAGLVRTAIWREELDRGACLGSRASYWVDTWSALCTIGRSGENRFLIGTDQALLMHRWHRFEVFWRDAMVMLRDEHDSREGFIAAMRALGVWGENELEHWSLHTVITPAIAASSSEIRAALVDPRRRENPIAGLDDRVHRYILENRLYMFA